MRWGLDYHIHTQHSDCGGPGVTVERVVNRAREVGLKSIGFTDHVNVPGDLEKFPVIRQEIATVKKHDLEVFFGCEVNFLSQQGDFPCDATALAEMQFDYVIAGVHSIYDAGDSRAVIDMYHTLQCLLTRQPWVDILVHPWWFIPREFKRNGVPWPEDLRDVPEEYALELAHLAKQHHTAIEVNAIAIFDHSAYSQRFCESYVDYLALLNDQGVTFAIGSDAHHLAGVGKSHVSEDILQRLGVEEERIWRPTGSHLQNVRHRSVSSDALS